MCGRYVEASPYSEIINWLDARATPIAEELYTPRWNISPTSTVLGMRMEDGERIVDNYRWGLVPSWVKELPRFASHNARVETVVTKPTFRSAWRARRRLLVPCQGYYEWQVLDDSPKPKKQPWYIKSATEPQLAVAGLFDFWRPPGSPAGSPWLVSCTVITTEPGADVADIHDRQPVVLTHDLWDVWIDPDTSTDEAFGLLHPAPSGTFARRKVGSAVGNSRNEGEALISPVDESHCDAGQPQGPNTFGILDRKAPKARLL